MKILATDSTKCTGCGKCEYICALAWRNTEDREKSAIRITTDEHLNYNINACNQCGNRHPNFIINVCDQCGECIDMCSSMALSRDGNGIVRLDKRLCVGCLICVGECIRDNMRYCDDLPEPFKCVSCGLCVRQCPGGALSITEV